MIRSLFSPRQFRGNVISRSCNMLRSYHSKDHPTEPKYSPEKKEMLSHALARTIDHGFTPEALTLGVKDSGYLDITRNAFPGDIFDVVKYHLDKEKDALVKQQDIIQDPTLSMNDKIRYLSIARLQGNIPYAKHLTQMTSLLLVPSNVPESLEKLAELSDEILWLAGDRSTDFSWYTRRGSLASIYASTELFMSQDESQDFVDTFSFLKRRLDANDSLSYSVHSVQEWLTFNSMATINVIQSQLARL